MASWSMADAAIAPEDVSAVAGLPGALKSLYAEISIQVCINGQAHLTKEV